MDALQSQAVSKATEQRRAVELQRIAAALARMELEEYGWCVKCGEPIASGRLEADPAAPCCITCAEQQDARI